MAFRRRSSAAGLRPVQRRNRPDCAGHKGPLQRKPGGELGWPDASLAPSSLNASLKRLGVETIDLYQLHASDMHTPVEETLSFLDDAVKAGKIHYIGLSNFTGWQLQLIVSTAKAMGVQVPVTLQPQCSLLSREIER